MLVPQPAMFKKTLTNWRAEKPSAGRLFLPMAALMLLGIHQTSAANLHPSSFILHPSAAVADAFDFPIDAVGTYGLCPQNTGAVCYWICRGFQDSVNNSCQVVGYGDHLGEDWNRGPVALADDYGDPVYAVANGEVIFAQANVPIPNRPHPWGKVVIIRHTLPDGTQVESQYAHLKDMSVTAGSIVTRGQIIGTIGDAEGYYVAHLHFEIRYSNSRAWGTPGPAWSTNATGWAHPSKFINTHRTLNCSFTPGQGTSGGELTAIQNAFVGAGGQAMLGCALGAVQTDGFTSSGGTVGHYQKFANGEIHYLTNGVRAGQSYALVGAMSTKWNSLGLNSNHPLGYPVGAQSARQIACDGTAMMRQDFENGALLYHLTNQRAEAVYEVHGQIYAEWVQNNAAQCPLGLPVSDVQSAPASGATGKVGLVSDFQGGHISWTNDEPEAYATYGPIDTLYVAMGRSAGWLGFPTTRQRVVNGYDHVDFEGGYITTADGVAFQAFPHNTPPVGADLSINITGSSDPVLVGSNLTYSVTVTNLGPLAATGVSLTDSLPSNITFVSATPSQGSCAGTGVVTCDLGTLAGNGVATLSLVVKAKSAGVISNTVTARALEYDANSVTLIPTGNNAMTLNTTAAVNQAPVVSAGADQTISLPATAALSGTATDDGLPSPPSLATTWSKVSGPGAVTFANANALSTSATFAAPGSYVLRLTANDGVLLSLDEVTVAVDPASGGLLTGSLGGPGAAIDLSGEGTLDWGHWGLSSATSFNRKGGTPQQISNYVRVGTGTVRRYTNNPTAFSWSGGAPTASATNTATGLYLGGLNNGFRLTLPADTQVRTVKLYVGVWAAQGRLEATLSDASAAAYVDAGLQDAATANGVYTISYRAASGGQTLTLRWTALSLSNTAGNVTLQAASLAADAGSVNQAPTITSPGSQTNAEGETVNLQLVATDPDGDTLTYGAAGLPGGLAVNTNTGQITGTLNFASAGNHSVAVTVSDGRGGAASANFTWTVHNTNQAPTVSLTSPGGGAVFTEPANITLNANAGDGDGGIAQVEFYANGASLGADQTAPYGITWSGVAAGSYTLTAVATDDAGASLTSNTVNITVQASVGGTLTGTLSASPFGVDLSAEGALDWGHWGLSSATSFNRKGGTPQQISNYVRVGGGTVRRYTNNPTLYSWAGGTPTASATNTATGIYLIGAGNGFRVTVPAGTQTRTLRLYVGVWAAQGRLEATLSDASAAAYVDAGLQDAATANGIYTLTYRAASEGQTLTLRWTAAGVTNASGNVTLQAASLVLGP